MKYLITKQEHFINERLSKTLKTSTIGSKDIIIDNKLNEIFDKSIETVYNITENSDDKIIIKFNTISLNEYEFGIYKIYEDKKGLVNHLAFTTWDNDEEYDRLTNKNEMIEILNRLKWILLDLLSKDIVKNYFCIGGADLEQKNKNYEYMLLVLVGIDGYKKIDTIYYKTGWGLYFSI